MSLEVCSKQIRDADNGGDQAMTKYGASPATAERGLTTNAAKYGGASNQASGTNYTPRNVKPGSNSLVGS